MKLKIGFKLLHALLGEQSTGTKRETVAFEETYYDGIAVKELFEIEARGREIALELGDKPAWVEVRNWIQWLEGHAVDITEIAKKRGDKDIYALSRTIVMAIGPVLTKLKQCENMRAGSLSDCQVGYDQVSYKVREAMVYIDQVCRNILGGSCCYFVEPYTLTMVVNDLASGFHRVAELVEQVSGKGYKAGKCIWYPGADMNLVDACREWDRLTRIFNELRLYDGSDYAELKATIRGRHAELRVGSAEGHRVHIDMDKKKLYYYDDDEEVNVILKGLLDDFCLRKGLLCWIERAGKTDIGVFCNHVTAENVKEIARCLAAVTSMDMRVPGPAIWWQKAISRVPGLVDACPELDEYCLAKTAIEYFKTHKRVPRAKKGREIEVIIKGLKKGVKNGKGGE